MQRTLIELAAERQVFERKRAALLRIMERRAGAATDTGLSNMRQLMRDYDARIAALTEEMESKRTLTTD